MAKKRPKINGKTVIGFDEINNGFHLNDKYGLDLPLLVVGYLLPRYPGSHHANEKYEKKGGVFTLDGGKNVRSLEEVQRRALVYLHSHQNFFYSRISEKDIKRRSMITRRAEAVAAITLRFIEEYRLNERSTFICLDHLGVGSSSEDLNFCMRELFNLAGIFRNSYDSHVYFQHYADKFNRACKIADHVGYHLLGLKFRGDRGKWPFSDRISDSRSFYGYLIDRLDRLSDD